MLCSIYPWIIRSAVEVRSQAHQAGSHEGKSGNDNMKLKWNLLTKGMRPHRQLQKKLQQKIDKLETQLEHFPSDAVHLQVNLERHPRKASFSASLILKLPSNILRAEKPGPDPVPAFDQAVKALLRAGGGALRASPPVPIRSFA